MSTEQQYPEISVDESGIVPPQSGRAPEWPKKIRTLTAAELDRLTIDATGRFYWDGKPVAYESQGRSETGSSDPLDRSALELMDRAALELSDPEKSGEAGTEVKPLDLDTLVTQIGASSQSPTPTVEAAETEQAILYSPKIRTTDRVRVSLSLWQSVAMFVLVAGVLISASGIAAYGWVMAHEWSCRVGLVKSYCPASPAYRERATTDIPA